MSKGKKYNDDVKEKAYALLGAGNSYSFVSRKLGIPESTLRGWKGQESNAENEENLVKLRAKKKEEFATRAWQAINLAQTLLERSLKRAVDENKEIDLGKLVTIIGTLYDKQALANKEATEIVDGEIGVRKFEDFK